MTQSVLDPAGSLSLIDDKLARLNDPVAQRNLASLRSRMLGELIGDSTLVFASVTEDFTLVMRAPGTAETITESGAFRAMLAGSAERGIMVWSTWAHMAVDADTLIADGTLYTAMPAAVAGLETDDPDALALATSSAFVILEFVDGLTRREILYSDPATRTVTAIQKSALPDRATLANQLQHA